MQKNISELFDECAVARKSEDWTSLETLSNELLLLLGQSKPSGNVLRKAAIFYLGSIIGVGTFILEPDQKLAEMYLSKVEKFRIFVNSKGLTFREILAPQLRCQAEIQLYLSNPNAGNMNKAAAALRRIARPDLAITLTSKQLEITRLNYYSLVVRSAAYLDVGRWEESLADIKIAQKYSPDSISKFASTVASRAFREKFKNLGDLEDGEASIFWARKALDFKIDQYSVNNFIASVRAMGIKSEEDFILRLQQMVFPKSNEPDQSAVMAAIDVLTEASTTNSQETVFVEQDFEAWTEEPDLDPWTDLDEDYDVDQSSDYYEDYFEDYVDSLNNPQMPHLEP